MSSYPGGDGYAARKVAVLVDNVSILEMIVWADTPEQAAYQVCRVGRSIMRAHVERLSTMERYASGQKRANDEDAGVGQT